MNCLDESYMYRFQEGYAKPLWLQEFFSEKNVKMLSQKITELLQGVLKDGVGIIVPNESIAHVMSQQQQNWVPPVGDPYSRYIIDRGDEGYSYFAKLNDRVIQIIVSQIRNEYDAIHCNEHLSAWKQILGTEDLRSHAPIKIKNKRPTSFQFHMNY